MSTTINGPHDVAEDGAAAEVAELETILNRTHGRDWVEASMRLADLGPAATGAISALSHGLLNGGGRLVHWAAAYAIGRIGPAAHAALPALHQALHDPSPDVRVEAREAIRRITGEAPAAV